MEISKSVQRKSSYHNNNNNNVKKIILNNGNEKSYSELASENWSDLILLITLIGSIIIIFYIWIKNFFNSEKRVYHSEKIFHSKIIYKDMSSKFVKKKNKFIENRVKREETCRIKSEESPSQKSNQSDDDIEESTNVESESRSQTRIPVTVPLFTNDSTSSQVSLTLQQQQQPQQSESKFKQSENSSLNLLQEEVFCIQPPQAKEVNLISIGTSPPPFFSPKLRPKYATRGTQTIFTKAPNSPLNIIQTPTSASSISSENKENFKKSKKKNIFKTDMEMFNYSPGNSPKTSNILQEQNSPTILQDSPSSSKFSFSPKILCSRNSPTVGSFFKFPDVTLTPEPVRKLTPQTSFDYSNVSQSECETSDLMRELSIDSEFILRIDEIEDNNEKYLPTPDLNQEKNRNTLTIRRQRLKSISLDSDEAKILNMEYQELLEEMSQNNNNNNNNNNQDDMSHEPEDANDLNKDDAKSRSNSKNIYNLTLNLNFRDNSLVTTNDDSDDMHLESNQNLDSDYENDDEFDKVKTPKITFRHKAVSLDSSSNPEPMKTYENKAQNKSETYNYYFGSSRSNSISVPSTPKHLTSTKLKISTSEEHQSKNSSRKFENFDKPIIVSSASGTTLNVSTSNLKTLPEITSINDFDKERKNSIPKSIPVKGLLQRRGSNHSLKIDIDGGSICNLSRGSCYSLGNLQGSHLNIAGSNCNLNNAHGSRIAYNTSGSVVKKNLLQRRGSNTSLTLNVSNNSLNRFNSHSSLNFCTKKGLLERRNSNASLTLNIQNRGLSISNCNLRGSECSLGSYTNQINDFIMAESEAEHDKQQHFNINSGHQHHRKFYSK